MMPTTVTRRACGSPVGSWRAEVLRRVADGQRFAGLYAAGGGARAQLVALLARAGGIDPVRAELVRTDGAPLTYPALTPELPAAFWYERALHDLSDITPTGHPRLDPLLLPRPDDTDAPLPGSAAVPAALAAVVRYGPADVSGRGIFSIPYGPVRSGVGESLEYLIETPGEDIPHINIRPHFKHRGVAKRFEGLGIDDAVLVAERVEGIASVAHALAFSHAVEALAGLEVPARARLIRVIFAELERVANHLDVAMRLCDAAGLAVAVARFGWHKEQVMRLVSAMCGSRFGRGVVVPGGVRDGLEIRPDVLTGALARLGDRIEADRATLMNTASFLDRLRRTGVLAGDRARIMAALGPVGRASGVDDDARRTRPYDAYAELVPIGRPQYAAGDAMSRLRVRWDEVHDALALIAAAAARLTDTSAQAVNARVLAGDGFATGWAEAPQGEVLYGLHLADGLVHRCFARSASFHNLVLMHDVWHGDVFTDFAFIEASFGLGYAAVAM